MSDLSPPQYQIDENGIPIKPGYRKPFTSETALQASLKGREARQRYFEARRSMAKSIIPSAILSTATLDVAGLIAASLRAHKRCLAAAVASTEARQAVMWMKAAKDAFDCWQKLVGKGTAKARKPMPSPIAPVAPISQPQPQSESVSGVVGVFPKPCQA